MASRDRLVGVGQAGNVRLLGIHALLWERPKREVPGSSLDHQGAHASNIGRDPRKAPAAAERTRACARGVASPGSEWRLRVPCSSGESVAIGRLPQRSLPRLAARPVAAKSTEPAQLVSLPSPHPQVRPAMPGSASLSGRALLRVKPQKRGASRSTLTKDPRRTVPRPVGLPSAQKKDKSLSEINTSTFSMRKHFPAALFRPSSSN